MPAFLHEGSKYMSWTILITYQNESTHVYSYRKLLLLLESEQFLKVPRGVARHSQYHLPFGASPRFKKVLALGKGNGEYPVKSESA